MSALEIALGFIDAINAGDVERMADLMSDDHRFIDALGAETVGRESMRESWEAYFRMVPGYQVEVEETFVGGDVVVLLGTAQGAFVRKGTPAQDSTWKTPAAWRALVRGGRVAVWRVYADNEPLRRLLAAEQS